MNDFTPTARDRIKRRQKIVLVTGVALVLAYYLFRVFPTSLGSGFALTAAVVIAGCGMYVSGLARISSWRWRIAYVVAPCLCVVTVLVVLSPNFRRASLQRKLQALGADVTSKTDRGSGVWFRVGGIYLPCWMQAQLGDAFFGDIDNVDFTSRVVPVDAIVGLNICDPVDTLNLSFAQVSNTDLVRLAEAIDARQVLLNSIPVDADTLESFGRMRSLRHLAVIETDVSLDEATEFKVRHPGINVIHGYSNTTGWAFVRVPIKGP